MTVARLALAAFAFLAAPAVAVAGTAPTSVLDQCKAEIGWSKLTPAQKASPETRFRLELCLKRKKVN